MRTSIRRFMRKILVFLKGLRVNLVDRYKKNIRFQLIVAFALCLISALFIVGITSPFVARYNRYSYISYMGGIEHIDFKARTVVHELTNSDVSLDDINHINKIMQQVGIDLDMKILIVDLDGDVLYKSVNATETKVDLHSVINNAMNIRLEWGYDYGAKEFFSFYPLTFKEERAYVIVSGVPRPKIIYENEKNSLMSFLVGSTAFIFIFMYLTKKKMKYIEVLAKGLVEISKGNLDYRIDKKSEDELGSLADNINDMAEKLKSKIEEERRANNLKNELITNVSHDLKTPLTSIMGYLRLVKDNKYENHEEMEEYINIAYGKSEKLKFLIEDLFEFTKLSNREVGLNKEKINLTELIEQLLDELTPIGEERSLDFEWTSSGEKILVEADGEKIVRVLENLLINAINYSYTPGKIMVEISKEDSKAVVTIKNRGDNIARSDLERLFDRFFRVEKSRSSNTGGSGLGLAIAKSIMALHGGEIGASCYNNDITFYIKLNTI